MSNLLKEDTTDRFNSWTENMIFCKVKRETSAREPQTAFASETSVPTAISTQWSPVNAISAVLRRARANYHYEIGPRRDSSSSATVRCSPDRMRQPRREPARATHSMDGAVRRSQEQQFGTFTISYGCCRYQIPGELLLQRTVGDEM
jgi:hypothetical protein